VSDGFEMNVVDVVCMTPDVATRLRPTPVLNVWKEIVPDFSAREKRAADDIQATHTPPTTPAMLMKTISAEKETGL